MNVHFIYYLTFHIIVKYLFYDDFTLGIFTQRVNKIEVMINALIYKIRTEKRITHGIASH